MEDYKKGVLPRKHGVAGKGGGQKSLDSRGD